MKMDVNTSSLNKEGGALDSNSHSLEFDALIELLGTDPDDTIHVHEKQAAPQGQTDGTPPPMLRDEQGMFDFGKIKDFFANSHGPVLSVPGTGNIHVAEDNLDSPAPVMDREEELQHMMACFPPFIPGPSSRQELPLPPILGQNNPASADISPLFLSPSQSATSLPQPFQASGHLRPPPTSLLRHGTANIMVESQRKTSTIPPSESPLDFVSLNRALQLAHAQMAALKSQYEDLRVEMERRGLQLDDQDNSTDTSRKESPDRLQSSSQPQGPAHQIDQLTGDEARSALKSISSSLRLPPTAVTDLLHSPSTPLLYEHQPRSIADVQRALSFFVDCDELVWKRHMIPDAHRIVLSNEEEEHLFDTKNVQSIKDRIELWERIVRG